MGAEDPGVSLLEMARGKVRKHGPECRIKAVKRMNPELADQLTELIDATPAPIPYKVASETLRDRSIDIKADTISRHRRGECGCSESA